MKLEITLPLKLKETVVIHNKELKIRDLSTGLILDNVVNICYNLSVSGIYEGVITLVNKENGVQWVEPIDYVVYTNEADMMVDSFFS